MDVEMKHRLPRPRAYIEHSPVALLDFPITRYLRCRQVTAPDHYGVVRLRFVQSRKMLLRDDQHVRRSLRADVFEGKDVIVLINLLRGNLAAKNTAEKAVTRGVGHRKTLRREI